MNVLIALKGTHFLFLFVYPAELATGNKKVKMCYGMFFLFVYKPTHEVDLFLYFIVVFMFISGFLFSSHYTQISNIVKEFTNNVGNAKQRVCIYELHDFQLFPVFLNRSGLISMQLLRLNILYCKTCILFCASQSNLIGFIFSCYY